MGFAEDVKVYMNFWIEIVSLQLIYDVMALSFLFTDTNLDPTFIVWHEFSSVIEIKGWRGGRCAESWMLFQESVELCILLIAANFWHQSNRGVATSRIVPICAFLADPHDALADPKWWEFDSIEANSKIWMASILNILTLGDALRMVTYSGSRKNILNYKNNECIYTYIYIYIS